MWMFFQITLTVFSALFVTAMFFVATWYGLSWGIVCGILAAICFIGVKICKSHTVDSSKEESLPEADENGEEPSREEKKQ